LPRLRTDKFKISAPFLGLIEPFLAMVNPALRTPAFDRKWHQLGAELLDMARAWDADHHPDDDGLAEKFVEAFGDPRP